MSTIKILICAVEPSGDALGAALMEALRRDAPHVEFLGCGGPLMANAGLHNLFSIESFSVMGPVGALKALPAAMRGAGELAKAAAAARPTAAVLIDSWAFSSMAASRIKRAAPETKLIKYVAPQVWASRPQRVEKLARLFDGLLTLFSFENEWFENKGVLTRFVGSSVFQAAASEDIDRNMFRNEYAIGDAPLLAVLPGSRKSEVRRLMASFGETIDILTRDFPDLQIALPVAPNVEEEVGRQSESWERRPILVPGKDRYRLFAAADGALAASGTVTTELAIFRTPMVVAYRVDWLSALWFRHVITTPYITLLNIVAGRSVVPELLQEDCTAEAMAGALSPLLAGEAQRAEQLEGFAEVLPGLGVGGAPAAQEAARAILEWIDQKKAI